jgi:hypothetical protein
MSITSIIETLNHQTSLKTLESLRNALYKTESSVSWLGIRKVAIWDTDESISLSRTAAKIHTLFSQSQDSFPAENRHKWSSICHVLQMTIEDSNQCVAACSDIFRVWVTCIDRIYLYIWNCYNWIQGRPLYLTLNAYETFFNAAFDRSKAPIRQYR